MGQPVGSYHYRRDAKRLETNRKDRGKAGAAWWISWALLVYGRHFLLELGLLLAQRHS